MADSGICPRCLTPAEQHPTADCAMTAELAQDSSERDWMRAAWDELRGLRSQVNEQQGADRG